MNACNYLKKNNNFDIVNNATNINSNTSSIICSNDFYNNIDILVMINCSLSNKVENNYNEINELNLYSNYSSKIDFNKNLLRKLILYKSNIVIGSLKTGSLDFEVIDSINKSNYLNSGLVNVTEHYYTINVRRSQIDLIKTILLLINSVKIHIL